MCHSYSKISISGSGHELSRLYIIIILTSEFLFLQLEIFICRKVWAT